MSDQPSLVEKLEAEQAKTELRSTLSPWGQEVAERVLELRDGLQHVDPSQREHLGEILDAAEWLAFDRVPLWRCITRLSDWWFGNRVERAWSLLHEAEVLFVEYADDRGFEIALETALGHAATLPTEDPVRLRFDTMVQAWPVQPTAPTSSNRTMVQAVLRRSFAQTDGFHHDARAFRNRLVITTMLSLVTALSIILLQWRLPQADIIQQPTGAEDVSRWALLILVMAFGAVGGLLTSIPALAALPRVNSPFNFPMQQAFLKIALGSLTAVVGVIVTGSAGVTTGYASMQALAGVALVFGAAQQAVTQFLDERADQILQGSS